MELIEYFHTYLQLSSDDECGGGLVVEIAGGDGSSSSSGGGGSSSALLGLAAQNVTLTQGAVLIIPSYAIRRPLPVLSSAEGGGGGRAAGGDSGGSSCEIVEGVFVGTDLGRHYRSAAVLVASEQAVAAQPHRRHQLRTVLQNNSEYMPLLTQAFNSHVLPTLSRSEKGFEITDVPAPLYKELMEHYETNRNGDNSCDVETAEECTR